MKKNETKLKNKKPSKNKTITEEAIELEKYIIAKRKFLKKLAWIIGFLSILLLIIKYGF